MCVICFGAALVCGTVSAAEIGLTSVLYPEGKKVDVPISGTQRAPASQLSAVVENRAGQSNIRIKYNGLQPAVLFGGDFVSYVVWTVAPDGTVENLGGIANDGNVKGEATFSTGQRDFAMMINAEPILGVQTPGDLVVFFSGTPATKNVQPTGFTFGGLSTREGLLTREHESIAGMTYKVDKKNPLELIQAEKAIELLERFDAQQFDPATYEKATAAMLQAREAKGQAVIDSSQQVVILAGQALRKTVRMIEAEELAAVEAAATAERVALVGQASGMQLELVETRAELEATQTKLTQTEAQLKKMQSQSMRLSQQRQALNSQLQGAMGKMATGTKTERGYIVSLSGTAFGSGKSTLTTDAKYVLAKLSGMLLAMPGATLMIEGHTDSTGSDELNQKLSTARAQSVKTYLSEMGFAASKMNSRGYGPSNPVAPNDNAEGRAKNRRVDIVITGT
jgi:outer membrane protein OmpA-like peptidoglycan-associated protein